MKDLPQTADIEAMLQADSCVLPRDIRQTAQGHHNTLRRLYDAMAEADERGCPHLSNATDSDAATGATSLTG